MALDGGLRHRSHRRELIDDPVRDPDDLARMHDELGVINRWLGGTRSSRAELEQRLGRMPRSLLDLGAGGLDLPRALLGRGGPDRILAVDLFRASCRDARRRLRDGDPIHVVCADGFRLPLPDHSVEVAHAALFLHHFPEDAVVRLLTEMARVATRGILINDLHRHPLALGGIRVLTAAFSRSHLIRHDAPLSVRRGFRREELRHLLDAAGLRGDIGWRWAFRYVVWCPLGPDHVDA